MTAGILTSAGLGFLFHLVTARGLGPSGYGAFAAALTYATLWAIAMEAGISIALTREAAADRTRLAWVPRLARWKVGPGLAGTAGALSSGAFYAGGTAICAVVNVMLNLALIPRMGGAGAAWASIATEAVLLAICLAGLGSLAREIPVRATALAVLASMLAVVVGWALLAGRPATRALLALVVSVGLWEGLSPWPLRHLGAAALGRAR